jgi:hypothetical protein
VQPLVTTAVLLFILARRMLHPNQNDRWYLPLAPSGSSEWAPLMTTLASSIISLISTWLLRLCALPELPWITAGSSSLLLLHCLFYSALVRIKIEMLCESKSTPILWDELLRKVSICSFALWTLFLAMYHPKISLPTVLILGTIRALHYFILFTLVSWCRGTLVCYHLLTEQ